MSTLKSMSSWERAFEQAEHEHIAIPRKVMQSEAFRHLTGSELRVLMLLIQQYRGFNNGSLAATKEAMSHRGGMAADTLAKSLRGLQERNLIVKTGDAFEGKTGSRCHLYALTWHPLNEQ